ncbi:peptide ABC transporter substrate-binding protein [Methylopila capsulata]|uniref:peptide ABC transporter substrate-binding protein n=1 Tax=Methylopila capsulata TaxID=61654 RepID=UPI001AEE61DC
MTPPLRRSGPFVTSLRRLALACLALLFATAASAEVVYDRGNSGEPETLDPHLVSTVQEANLMRELFEGLTAHDGRADVVPGVAERWEVSDDGRTWVFTLRPDARWSNGDPVTAEDFAFSLRRILDPSFAAKYANLLYPILNAEKVNKGEAPREALGVVARDARTLEIRLERPTPYFLELLTHQTTYPVHRASVERFGRDWLKPGRMVTNGAYRLAENLPNDHIRLEKNPFFHAASEVAIDVVNYVPLEDRGAALRRFQTGEIQSYDDVPAEQIAFIRRTLGDQLRIAPYVGVYYYAVNVRKAPFSDPRIRRALSMALDREFIADKVWAGTMLPAYGWVPPGFDGYAPVEASWRAMSQLEREDAASALLKQAGYGPGAKRLEVEIRYNSSENHQNTATAIADMWKAIGVSTRLINSDGKTHFAHLQNGGDFDVARAAWIADYRDPQNFLFLGLSDNVGFNYPGWKSPPYDALVKASDDIADPAARLATLGKAEAILVDEQPMIPILFYASKALVSHRLKGWEDNVMDIHPTRYLRLEP